MEISRSQSVERMEYAVIILPDFRVLGLPYDSVRPTI